MLLPSGPDTVRDSPLRGTRSSTSPGPAASERGDLGMEFSPAGADCRFRAPLVPRLARPVQSSSHGPPSLQGTRESGRGESSPDARRNESWLARSGGEGGIRTLDALPRTAFPVRRHSPLGDLSARLRADPGAGTVSLLPRSRSARGGGEHASERTQTCVTERADPTTKGWPVRGESVWRRGWDSNPRCFRTPLFESGTINHSDTSPRERIAGGSPGARPGERVSTRSRRPRAALRPRRGGSH